MVEAAGIEPGAPNEAAITANLHRATRVPTRKDIAQRYAGVPAHAPNKKGPQRGPFLFGGGGDPEFRVSPRCMPLHNILNYIVILDFHCLIPYHQVASNSIVFVGSIDGSLNLDQFDFRFDKVVVGSFGLDKSISRT